jgi:hypothetical protein
MGLIITNKLLILIVPYQIITISPYNYNPLAGSAGVPLRGHSEGEAADRYQGG